MAHHKSAIKRIRRNDSANVRNSQYLSTVRTAVKRFRVAVTGLQEGTVEKSALAPLFVSAQSMLAKAASKGILHKNNAIRKIGRLSKLLSSAEKGTIEVTTATKSGKKSPAKKPAAGAAKAKPAAAVAKAKAAKAAPKK